MKDGCRAQGFATVSLVPSHQEVSSHDSQAQKQWRLLMWSEPSETWAHVIPSFHANLTLCCSDETWLMDHVDYLNSQHHLNNWQVLTEFPLQAITKASSKWQVDKTQTKPGQCGAWGTPR